MQLVIGNKNYSSWSMRPWLLMRGFELPFEEVRVRFDSFDAGSRFKQTLLGYTPTGRVPVLVDGDLRVWDSLAIAEYLAERFPQHAMWPRDAAARARARCVCAEMHGGFSALRSHFPVNIEARLPEVGARVLAQEPQVVADVQRIEAIWTDALRASGGPFLFGAFGIADAYFAPVATRLRTYGVAVSPEAEAWIDRLHATPALQQWVSEALAERDFLAFEEPYRSAAEAGYGPAA